MLASNKNDINDAEAICEAVSRPQMRFVPAKSVEQQDIRSLHRVRSRLMSLARYPKQVAREGAREPRY